MLSGRAVVFSAVCRSVVTGLLYVDPLATDLHTALNTTARPLNALEAGDLCPGVKLLDRINASLR